MIYDVVPRGQSSNGPDVVPRTVVSEPTSTPVVEKPKHHYLLLGLLICVILLHVGAVFRYDIEKYLFSKQRNEYRESYRCNPCRHPHGVDIFKRGRHIPVGE